MIFHAAERDLDFVIDGKRYVVPKNSNVDIPDAVAYCVKWHGIALAEGPSGAKAPVMVKPTKPAVRARPKRDDGAKEMRRELEEITGGPGDDDDLDDEA